MEKSRANEIASVVRRVWGFETLRPLQAEAMEAAIAGRDALVVMPTGGGKSLCYQVPPLVTGQLTVVVSPLIALMQDQVAGLKLAGVPAAALHGHVSAGEVQEARDAVKEGRLRLLFAAPERLMTPGFLAWLANSPGGVGGLAIDESHCISQWGHDFRPEYRRLAELREVFPGVSIQAYTATATPRVRRDILDQLHLRDPVELVGRFDRPNLTYRVVRRGGGWARDSIAEIVRAASASGAAIVYCMTRRETEEVAADLKHQGLEAEAYHAGMDKKARDRVADDFREERLNVVAATVAFGMGIDRSDVRAVIHASMPQTVEHWQQETGRAGRDGLPAECVMFYSASDAERWRMILSMPNADGTEKDPEFIERQMELVQRTRRLAGGMVCRHKGLSEYFGQPYERVGCGACDVCLGDHRPLEGGDEVAKKILSCVARVKERFGAGHVADVLLGKNTERIIQYRHADLSTYGLLRGMRKTEVMAYTNQLLDAGLLERTDEEFSVLRLNEGSWEVMRGTRRAGLMDVGRLQRRRERTDAAPMTAEESGLFESLRGLRRRVADSMAVPPFVVFSDATLREIARRRPGSLESLSMVPGVGQKKLEQFGEIFLGAVRDDCAARGLALDAEGMLTAPCEGATAPAKGSASDAAELFAQGKGVEEVAAALGRALSTTWGYLDRYVEAAQPESLRAWVSEEDYASVVETAKRMEDDRLAPIYEALGGRVHYGQIRIVLRHAAAKPLPPLPAEEGVAAATGGGPDARAGDRDVQRPRG